jgi:hypothetical protein
MPIELLKRLAMTLAHETGRPVAVIQTGPDSWALRNLRLAMRSGNRVVFVFDPIGNQEGRYVQAYRN